MFTLEVQTFISISENIVTVHVPFVELDVFSLGPRFFSPDLLYRL